ncbi:MAG TPA: haloacid dehalogenase type II [Candidatus Acidoferrales bacterium]|nr:haloacid dehalogenase type II [Candidatus Acidoferrales bacterium]
MSSKPTHQLPRILVLDVNETLLDVNTLRPFFERFFGDGDVLKEWFARTLLYSQTVTQTNNYVDFSTVARLALEMTAKIHGVQCHEADTASILDAMKSLPAHPEVPGALQRLRQDGFRLVTLTNSSQSVAEAQMHSADLAHLCERIFSVDAVRKFKPHPEPYHYVAKQLNVKTSEMVMIAAHPWDLMGAKAAGLEVGFVKRPGASWFALSPMPELSASTLDELATRLITRE